MNTFTHISIILDRTGSMEPIRDDIIGGFNVFLQEQKDQPGSATLTLIQFDSQDSYEIIHPYVSIEKVPSLDRATYVPRAGTPLFDAIGRGINDLEAKIGQLPLPPDNIIFVIVTDGLENASQEFTLQDIQKMVTTKQKNAGWQFVFLSADMAAFEQALQAQFTHDSSLYFSRTGKGSKAAFKSLSHRTTEYRGKKKKFIGFDEVDREEAGE